jgi:hypothetical protein
MSQTGVYWRKWVELGVALVVAAAVVVVGPSPAHAQVSFGSTPLAGWRTNGPAYAVKVAGGRVYLGGTFSQVIAPDGTAVARANLAAFDAATGTLDAAFRADTNGTVRALVSDGTTVWAGGNFTTVGGASRNRIAAVDAATGALRPFAAQANSPVYSLDLRAGQLFVGGTFSTLGGAARNRAAALNPTTGAVGAFAPQPNGTVRAIRANPAGTVVYLAGDFSTIGGQVRNGLAAVSGTSATPIAPVFADTYRPTLGLDMDENGTSLFAAAGGQGNQVAAYNPTTGTRTWRQRADGDVQAVAYHNGTVYWGFHEGFEVDTTLRMLASDAVTGAIDPALRPTFDLFWGVWAISATDEGLAVGGDFDWVTGVRAAGVATFPARAVVPPQNLLTADSTWSYLAQASAAPAGWQAPGFDDSAWPGGRPQLGYGDGDETTVVPFGPRSGSKWITTYLRTTFTVGTLPSSATLSLLVDDGAVVYLNGTELLRDNMPAGVVTYGTLASTNRSGIAENQFRVFNVPVSRLVTGVNTIAVELHQDNQASSDLGFDVRLVATT